ncbi:Fe-S-containing hydro-lyase [Alkalibacter saccharofermentans]|uniref:Fumarate hydratase subunit beta n=1 Tax=Alkalibacter saccharofermentans DSM 14828 TaxID=1120975 RepID=A0A1M4T9M3_9FIRM|nr:Fe-S-containing hydro-lyase [Alkalibacter saccharofermentans]SHE41048.1 fumarate hydratase subunit beta [Alkalibacter saccharofermentans DSM 14828]
MKEIIINLPLDDKTASGLKAGDRVLLNGIIYTARDAAHKKMVEEMDSGKPLPIDIKNQTIYYAGPCPAKPGDVIGSIGPTTSGRMDSYAPKLIEKGLKGMIGKGERNQDVINAMKEHGAVYFGAVGGAGALLKESVVSAQVVAYDELGTEAIRKLKVKNFPAVVIIDSSGENLYITQTKKYKRTLED